MTNGTTQAYEVKILTTTKELTARQKISITDLASATQLDEILTDEVNTVDIALDYFVLLAIHNEKSKDKVDYQKIILVTETGERICTGSEHLIAKILDIYNILNSADDFKDVTLKLVSKESNNYKGKRFYTCALI